jgi:ubiquinone biosynthesis UbiH/UbiF/VisC/COQ6 family hydroxylase
VTRARVIIAGGGPVGLSLACALRDCEATVVDAAGAAPAPSGAFDVRIFALSPGSRAFLREVGAWDHLDPRRIAPVRRMEIFGDAGARLSFSGKAGGAMAWIVEAGGLARALDEQAASLAHVRVLRGRRAVAVAASADAASVELEGGERLEGELLVGADGPDSRVRALLGLPAEEDPYGEDAVVANFDTTREHGDVARQWFRADGVLAWLPLPGKRISIVWSTPGAHAAELAALDANAFQERVRDAGHAALGDLNLVSTVARFPLRLIRVERTVGPGAALVGDAAHAVHPLAGQGVNLGFQDARLLAVEIAGRSALERAGDVRVLRRYARGRREDVTAMQYVTDSLDRLFAAQGPGASWLRNAGMRVLETQGWAKDALAGRAMR